MKIYMTGVKEMMTDWLAQQGERQLVGSAKNCG